MNMNSCKSILFLGLFLWLILPAKAQEEHFQVINSIPHLPVFNSTDLVSSPQPGAMVFSVTNNSVQVFSGMYWDNFCTVLKPESIDAKPYFRVEGGIPYLPVRALLNGAAYPGALYYSTSDPGIHINNGGEWYSTLDLPTVGGLTPNSLTKTGNITGIEGGIAIPVLDDLPTGVQIGAIYIDRLSGQLQAYNGTDWVSAGCAVCAPYADGVFIDGDWDKLNLAGAYTYYQKDGNSESGSLYRWFLADDDVGNNAAEDGTGDTWAAYNNSKEQKYLQFQVTPIASTGQIGTTVESEWYLLHNCAPYAEGLVASSDDWGYSGAVNLDAGYSYYDKEGDAEGASVVTWYISSAAGVQDQDTELGTDAAHTYTYSNSDEGKYLSFTVQPISGAGYTDGAVYSSAYYEIHNCEPQLNNALVNNNWEIDGSLNAGYSYYDKENDAVSSIAYQWYTADDANGTNPVAISGETGATYIPVDSDNGKWLGVEVITNTTAGYVAELRDTSLFIQLDNCAPYVDGLLAEADDWGYSADVNFEAGYTYYDKEGDAEGASVVTWYISSAAGVQDQGTELGTGDTHTYTYTNADEGKYISFTVEPMAATGMQVGSIDTSGYYEVHNCAPYAEGLVASSDDWGYSGAVNLDAGYSYYDKEGDAEGASVVTWYISSAAGVQDQGTELGTGAAHTYTYSNSDEGKYLSFTVQPISGAGYTDGAVYSSAYYEIHNCEPQLNNALVNNNWSINGSLNAGYSYYDKENDAVSSIAYQWYTADDVNGTNPVAISGETGATYIPVDSDNGKWLGVEVITNTTAGYVAELRDTSLFIQLDNCAPYVDGLLAEADDWGYSADVNFEAGYTYYDKEGDAEGTSVVTWYISSAAGVQDQGTELGTGDTHTYTYTNADEGKYISFTVEPMAVTGMLVGIIDTSGYYEIHNCAPYAEGLVASSDDWGYSGAVNLDAGYSYYDKEGDAEGASVVTWYISSAAGVQDQDTELGTDAAHTYTYSNSDEGKYLSFTVQPISGAGYTDGAVYSSAYYEIHNCEPQLNNALVNNNWSINGSLNAGYSYYDKENDAVSSIAYQWYTADDVNGTNPVAISGETGATYIPVDSDNGKWLGVEVITNTTAGYVTELRDTSLFIQLDNCAPYADGLLAEADDWGYSADVNFEAGYTYYDKEGDAEGTSVVTWYISSAAGVQDQGTELGTGDTHTYTYTNADEGKYISFTVEPMAATGTQVGSIDTSGYYEVHNCAPYAEGLVASSDDWGYSGAVNLDAGYSYYDKEGDAEGASVVTWYISSAAGVQDQDTELGTDAAYTYTYSNSDEGKYLSFTVQPISGAGYTDGAVCSSSYYEIHNCEPQLNNALVNNNWSINGSLNAGYSYYDKEGDAMSSVAYQWYTADDVNGTNPVAISGETGATYIPVDSDNGKWLGVEVITNTTAGYVAELRDTSLFIQLDNCAPYVDGLLAEADDWGYSADVNFEAGYTYYDKEGDAEGTSVVTWYISSAAGVQDQGTELGTGDTHTYTYTNADEGKYISFTVEPMAVTGMLVGIIDTSGYYEIHNCAPYAEALVASSDDWNYPGAVNLDAGYSYYDKEGDAEGASVVTWYISSAAGVQDQDTELGTDAAYTYTYSNSDEGKYLSFTVQPISGAGYTDGAVYSSVYYEIHNCEPQLNNALVNNNWSINGSLNAGYSYYDKENDAVSSVAYQWYTADDVNGTNPVAISGETGATYIPVDSDNGKWLGVEVITNTTAGYVAELRDTSLFIQLDNCAPYADGLLAEADDWGYSADVNFEAGYTYYDKEGDTEGASVVTWYISSAAGVQDQGTELGTGDTHTYTYTNADEGKYISFTVEPVAVTGMLVGSIDTSGYYEIHNCAPYAEGLVASSDDWGYSGAVNLDAGYSYYDKEGDAEGASVVTWYISSAAGVQDQDTELGTDAAHTYTYSNSDEGKYLSFTVQPISGAGYTDGAVYSSAYYEIHNCEPQLNNALVNNNWEIDGSLNAGYSYYDKENDAVSSIAYQWYTADDANGTNPVAISGETGATYIPVDSDNGKWLGVEVITNTTAGYVAELRDTSLFIQLDNCAPYVDGLLAEADDWGYSADVNFEAGYTYYDKEGDAEGASVVTWYISSAAGVQDQGTELGTGDTHTYTYTNADEGKYISFTVEPMAATGMQVGSIDTSGYYEVHNCAPYAEGLVASSDDWGYSGAVNLDAGYSYYDKEGDAEGASVVTWYISSAAGVQDQGTELGTGAAHTYTYSNSDEGKYLSFTVQPISGAGYTDGAVYSSAYYEIHNCEPQLNNALVNNNWSINGSLNAGYSYYDKENDAVSSVAYQWYTADDVNGTNPVAISGETGATYIPVDSDNGKWLGVEVITNTTAGYVAELRDTSLFIQLDNCAPYVDGLLAEADDWGYSADVNFEAGYTYYDKEGDAEGASVVTWYISSAAGVQDQGTELGTGDTHTYTYTNADEGKYISFTVEPMAATGMQVGSIDTSGYYEVHNCAPYAEGLVASSDDWNYPGAVNLDAGYSYYDKEGDAEGASVVTWYISSAAGVQDQGTELGTGAAHTYTYSNSDEGKYLSFTVQPISGAGYTDGAVYSSAYYEIHNCEPQLNNALVNNNWEINGSLNAGYSYYDKENDAVSSIAYQWYTADDVNGTNPVAISGETGATYIPVDSDNGKWLGVEVITNTTAGYVAELRDTSLFIQLDNCAPYADGLLAEADDWGYSADVNFEAGYTYYDKESNAEGASVVTWYISSAAGVQDQGTELGTGDTYTYTYTDADEGKYISFTVEPMAATGLHAGALSTSGYYEIHNDGPIASNVAFTPTSSSFSATETFTGTFTYSDIENDAEGDAVYTWYVSDDAAATVNKVELAAGGTDALFNYDYTDAHQDKYISLGVTPKAIAGYSTGAEAMSSSVLIHNDPPVLSAPVIEGLTEVGQTLFATFSYSDTENDAEATHLYQWYRDNLSTPITGATGTSYQLTAADAGHTIGVAIIPKAASGYSTGDTVSSFTAETIVQP